MSREKRKIVVAQVLKDRIEDAHTKWRIVLPWVSLSVR